MSEGSSKCLTERGLLTNFCELKDMMKPFGMFNKDIIVCCSLLVLTTKDFKFQGSIFVVSS